MIHFEDSDKDVIFTPDPVCTAQLGHLTSTLQQWLPSASGRSELDGAVKE